MVTEQINEAEKLKTACEILQFPLVSHMAANDVGEPEVETTAKTTELCSVQEQSPRPEAARDQKTSHHLTFTCKSAQTASCVLHVCVLISVLLWDSQRADVFEQWRRIWFRL